MQSSRSACKCTSPVQGQTSKTLKRTSLQSQQKSGGFVSLQTESFVFEKGKSFVSYEAYEEVLRSL